MIIFGVIFIILGSISAFYDYKKNKERREKGEEESLTAAMLMIRGVGMAFIGIMLILLKLEII